MSFETQLKMSLVQISNFLSWSAIISQIISCKKGERLLHASDKKGQNLSARACLQADIVQIPSISL